MLCIRLLLLDSTMANAANKRHDGCDQGDLSMPQPVIDDDIRIKLEAASFRRLLAHLQERVDVPNIDMMNLAGFCRNCLSRWYREAAAEQGIAIADIDARATVYGMPYQDWQVKYQKPANSEQLSRLSKLDPEH